MLRVDFERDGRISVVDDNQVRHEFGTIREAEEFIFAEQARLGAAGLMAAQNVAPSSRNVWLDR